MEVKEQLSYLEAEYDRQKTLLDENITSQKSFLNAESNYKTALAKFNGLNKQLTMLNISPSRVKEGKISSVVGIYAPINGSIAKINVAKGQFVSPTTEIMEIIDNSHIHLELSVFEKDILKIKKGQDIRFMIPEAADKVFNGEVYLVGTSIDENRTIKVHGHPTDESHNFLTGMFVNAEILIDSQKANALPENAVLEGEKGHYILVLDEEQKDSFYFKKIKVDVTNTSNNYTFFNAKESFDASGKILTKGAYGVLTN
jgi:cobalt-zinc-cadmium efflux system membrane fusion protein